ncbi:vitamin K epoxide reductase [Candidatus Saccharibacteria bacterium]|nr:vitamin K epoxide reductase [Candidatus Saccharibacteria bacterium]MBJ58607.1 vitamin K epoxide reductase [Candidatus Saccharibacteria bacterium]MBQ68583.1 vitamin K epoxide reductase [Candidatus Saccharibacteria bacterium]|tara:strand:- start:3682 stop:4314 length:633 start_codon:yes stop_codon:yes gene_type:complete
MLDALKKFLLRSKKNEKSDALVFSLMLAAGAVALAAAFVLTLEKFHLYEEPDAVLSCSINLVLNCSTVMQTWQSEVFGFPNMVIGLMAYAVVVTVAVVGLAGAKLPRWFWIAANIGFLLGTIFSYWLFFQSVYAIQVLCPWCLLVTASTTIIFSTMLHFNLKHNIFQFKRAANERVQRFLGGGYHQMIVLGWLALMVALVVLQFGEALFA